MSKTHKKFPLIFAVFTHILFAISVAAQDFEVKVKILLPDQPFVRVEINFPGGETGKKFSFPPSYADAEGLDLRIQNLTIKNNKNQEIRIAKSSGGEFQIAADFSTAFYDLNLAIPENALTGAHISWLAETHGLLMTGDLLPDFGKRAAKVSFELPENWKISTSEKRAGEKTFQVNNVQNAVFLVGTNWRQSVVSIEETTITFSSVGDWKFSEAEGAKITAEILMEYRKLFGAIPEKNINVFLLRPPREIGFERWRAETRGANVTILSSPTVFEGQATQRLHEQLRHEIFHIWMPNNLNLSGDYAWFYEGFTQYAALRTGLKLNRITFSNFLNTLEQAINLSGGRKQPASLLEASKSRWNAANSGVYSEGMLIAFLCDTALLRESRGKIDLLEVFRQIYQKHSPPNTQTDANAAILKILQSYNELVTIVEKYIKGADKINLAKDLDATGIEVVPNRNGQKLQIKTKLRAREKDLLNKLGYNNWRNFLRKSK
jgi:hypothetical protein